MKVNYWMPETTTVHSAGGRFEPLYDSQFGYLSEFENCRNMGSKSYYKNTVWITVFLETLSVLICGEAWDLIRRSVRRSL